MKEQKVYVAIVTYNRNFVRNLVFVIYSNISLFAIIDTS